METLSEVCFMPYAMQMSLSKTRSGVKLLCNDLTGFSFACGMIYLNHLLFSFLHSDEIASNAYFNLSCAGYLAIHLSAGVVSCGMDGKLEIKH